MLKLTEDTIRSISRKTGIPADKIVNMSSSEIDDFIQKKIKKNLEVSIIPDERLLGRGSVYLTLNRLSKISQIDKRLSKI